jgi:hypothetical protein
MSQEQPEKSEALARTIFSPDALAGVEAQASVLLAGIQALEIQSDVDLALCDGAQQLAHEQLKSISEMEKSATAPLSQALDVIRGWFRQPKGSFASVKQIAASKSGSYREAVELRKREALQVAAASASTDHAKATAAVVAYNELASVSDKGVSGSWVPEIVDPPRVPPEFRSPDPKLLKAAGKGYPANNAPPAIPGVVWRREAKTRSKAAK